MARVERPIAIVGGGIGGLAAAAALARAGLPVEVFERAPEIREVGAGLTIQCNAVLALARIGLAERVIAAGVPIRRTRIRLRSGRTLAEPPVEPLYAELGAPALGIHRATLQRILLDAAGPERVHTGAECTGFAAGAEGVTVRFSDGREVAARALVGADGLRSVVRAQLLGDGAPRYAGYVSWRGVTADAAAFAGLEATAFESWGRGRRFGGVAIDGARYYWFAVADAPAGGRDGPEGARAALLGLLRGWHEPVERLVAATPEGAILRTDTCDRPPVETWGAGPVTLLGDAAHPMTPNLGQGACQAIEDAVVLADCAARAPDLAAALRRYEARRRPRTRWLQERSWRLGRVAQWKSPLACAARNAVLRLAPARAMLADLRRTWRFEG
jgi:2-polyprenyl-6-methoxyphenol hydroxylase-like FAD-dependent oxidoreductase